MWQEIAIILIGIIIILYLGRKIYRFIIHPSKKDTLVLVAVDAR